MKDQKKKLAKGLYNWAVLGIVLVGVILFNIINSFVYLRYDVTEDQRYSLSDSTIDFLQESGNFKSRVSVKIYLAGELPAEVEHFRVAIEDKLKEFKNYAGDRIEYQFINPKVGTEEEIRDLEDRLFDRGNGILPMTLLYQKDGSQSQMRIWPGAILDYGGAGTGSKRQAIQLMPGTKDGRPFQLNQIEHIIQNSTNDLEYMLVSALRRVIQEHKPRIGFLQGHGELSYAQTQRARALINPYFSVSDVELNDSIGALNGYDGLIIARPKRKFSDKDLYLIDQFVMRGGRLMCFMDKLNVPLDTLSKYGETPTTRIETGLDKLLFDYGLKLEDNLVLDWECMPKAVRLDKQAMIPWFYHIKATPTKHPIARNLDPVALEYTSEIKLVEPDQGDKYVVRPILTSSANSMSTGMAPQVSYLLPIERGNEPLAPDPTNMANAKCIAALSSGRFTSYFRTRIVDEFANNPDSKFLKESSTDGKVMLIGNGRFFENQYDSMPVRGGENRFQYRPKLDINDLKQNRELALAGYNHILGNQEFFQNLTDFMMGETSVVDLRSKSIGLHPIDADKVKADAAFYKLINLGLPIVLILGLALVMNYMRKRKFAR